MSPVKHLGNFENLALKKILPISRFQETRNGPNFSNDDNFFHSLIHLTVLVGDVRAF